MNYDALQVTVSRGFPVGISSTCHTVTSRQIQSSYRSSNATKVVLLLAASLGAAYPGVPDGYYFTTRAVDVQVDYFLPLQLNLSGSTRVSFSIERGVVLSLPPNTQYPLNVSITAVSGVSVGYQQYSITDCGEVTGKRISASVVTAFPLRCPGSTVLLIQDPSSVSSYFTSVVDVSVAQSTGQRIRFSYSASSPTSNLFAVNLTSSLLEQPVVTIDIPSSDSAAEVLVSSPEAGELLSFASRQTCCSGRITGTTSDTVTGRVEFSTSGAMVDFGRPTTAGNKTVFLKVLFGTDLCTENPSVPQCDGIITTPIRLVAAPLAPSETLRTLDFLYPGVSSTCRDTIIRLSCLAVAESCTPGQKPLFCQQQCFADLRAACPLLPFGLHAQACFAASAECESTPAQPLAAPQSTMVEAGICAAPVAPPIDSTESPIISKTSGSSLNLSLMAVTIAVCLWAW